MNSHVSAAFTRFVGSARHMGDSVIDRLPSLVLAILVFVLFYIISIFVSRFIRQSTRTHRQNLGVVFARLIGAATILLGFLVGVSIVAPSFQATDLIKILGIGGVAIGFAFQNILQNFLAGLLLLWSEPFRVGDEIRIDPYEGTVEDIQTRATIIKTYDKRQVVVPNADLFTRAVIVNTAHDVRRWQFDFTAKIASDVNDLKSRILGAVRNVPGILSDPAPELLVADLDPANEDALKFRLLWWTKSPHQHEMLTSYDAVIAAVWGASKSRSPHQGKADDKAAA
jgi:small conductance mechanosensitive channel